MQNLDFIAKELFNKIRGRFPSVSIGDGEGNVTNEPQQARYFDFNFVTEGRPVGKVSISLDEKQLAVVYGKDLVTSESDITKGNWYDFLKELRQFAKKRLLAFDTRDITKSNLNTRDYKFLSTNRSGEEQMSESKLYGTSRTSYQDVGAARLMFKHSAPINVEMPAGRTQHISSIYIESAEGERFKYPYRHIAGARAMARHVAEGGKPFDDFGSHITGLSEELNKLRKFKSYMNRSSVMAEGLADYMGIVNERIQSVKKTIERIQKPAAYQEAFEGFEKPVFEEVPDDVKENWIDELTIKQFNEELADVFPYIYKLVKEGTRAQELTAEDFIDEAGKMKGGADDPCWKGYKMVGKKKKGGKEVPNCVPREEMELEDAFETTMGQFSDHVCEDCGNPSWRTLSSTVIEEIEEAEKKGLYYYVNKRKKAGTSRPKGHSKAPSDQDWKNAAKTAKESVEGTNEEKQKGLDGKVCWKGYKRMGTKMKDGKRVDNCVKIKKEDSVNEAPHQFAKGDKVRFKGKDDTFIIYNLAAQGDDPDTVYLQEPGKTSTQAAAASSLEPAESAGFKKGEQVKYVGKFAKDLGDVVIYRRPDMSEPDKHWIETKSGPWQVTADELEKAEGKIVPIPEIDDDTMDVKINSKGQLSKADADDEEQKTPLGEFILSYYDRETGAFPKGETAVLTMIEKDYGEEYIEPAKQFIEQVYSVTEQYREPEQSSEMARMRELAGLR